MNKQPVLSSLAMQGAVSCLLCTLVYLMNLHTTQGMLYYPLVLIPYGILIYAFNRVYLRRQRPLIALVLLNLAAGLGVFASAVALQIWGNWPNVVFAGVFFFWLTMQGIQLAIKPPRLFSLIFCLDASLLALVLFVGYASAVGVPLMWAMPIMAGCAASILGVICQRIGSQMTGRSWAMVLAAFAAIFLLVWLLVSFVAAPAGGGLVTVWNAITGLIGFLGGQVWRLLCWIASLFPEPGDNGNLEDLQANPEDYLPEEQPMEAENPVISAILAMMTIAAVILLAVWLVRQLLKIRIGGIRRQEVENTGPQRQRISLWAGLKTLFSRWAAWLRLRLLLHRRRDLPDGLFYLLVYRCRTGPWRKRPWETPREFLTRLQSCAEGNAPLSSALGQLLPLVDESLFSGRAVTKPFPQAALVRRQIGHAVRRQFMRDLFHRARPIPKRSAKKAES